MTQGNASFIFPGSKKHAVNFAIIILPSILVMSFLIFIKPPESISIFSSETSEVQAPSPYSLFITTLLFNLPPPLSISVMGSKLIVLQFGYSMAYNKKWD